MLENTRIKNVASFVNAGNKNLAGTKLLFLYYITLSFLAFLACYLGSLDANEYQWLVRFILFGCTILFIVGQIISLYQLYSTENQKWVILQNNICWAFGGMCFLLMSWNGILSVSGNVLYCIAEVLLFICFFIVANFHALQCIKKGRINDRKITPRLHYNGTKNYTYAIIGVAIFNVSNSLSRSSSKEFLDIVTIIEFLVLSLFFIGASDGFLKFYYATKYDTKVIPTWLDRYENLTFRKFNFKTEMNDNFLITIKRDKETADSHFAEVYYNEIGGYRHILTTHVITMNKKSFHIDTILNENGIVCYSLNGAPFGKLSDGRFIDFRKVRLEGEPNPEIVWIAETLIQQDIQWFDDFGEYLVKSNSKIGIEITKRYQDKSFTEVERQQIEEHSLDADEIAEWAKNIGTVNFDL